MPYLGRCPSSFLPWIGWQPDLTFEQKKGCIGNLGCYQLGIREHAAVQLYGKSVELIAMRSIGLMLVCPDQRDTGPINEDFDHKSLIWLRDINSPSLQNIPVQSVNATTKRGERYRFPTRRPLVQDVLSHQLLLNENGNWVIQFAPASEPREWRLAYNGKSNWLASAGASHLAPGEEARLTTASHPVAWQSPAS